LDLKSLIDNLDENSHEYQKWDNVIDRQNTLLAYSAKCCRPKVPAFMLNPCEMHVYLLS